MLTYYIHKCNLELITLPLPAVLHLLCPCKREEMQLTTIDFHLLSKKNHDASVEPFTYCVSKSEEVCNVIIM